MSLWRPVLAALALAAASRAAEPGAELYKQKCALCHEASATTRAPGPQALAALSPAHIVRSLESGLMKVQGAELSADQRRTVAAYLGKAVDRAPATAAGALCTGAPPPVRPGASDWNGWGAGLTNARFQTAAAAGLPATDVPRLKLKWAFGFDKTFVANGQPTVVGGRLFVASANRSIYSLDAATGCQYWAFESVAPVRTAITVAAIGEGSTYAAFFGDQRGTAYAVNASDGQLLWKVHVDDHPNAKIVGAPVFHAGRLYVPITAGEEGPSMNPKYECCSGRGGIAALDAATGKQLWKTYTIAEEPRVTGKNWAGAKTWGPSGASIWSAPTIDPERGVLYAATGDNFSEPATKTSDAILAFDLKTGKMLWATQLTENDAFNMGCMDAKKEGCPAPLGPDFDFGASPILVKLRSGRRMLIGSQKSGFVHAIDADTGKIVWQKQVGKGGTLGGIQWGSTADDTNVYAAVSDVRLTGTFPKLEPDPKAGGGLFAIALATGEKIWAAAPPDCGTRPRCSPAQSAAVTSIPGVVFSGSVDAHLRGYSSADGKVLWDFDTAREFPTVNGVTAKGGSMDGPGPAVAGGMLYVVSGYGAWGGLQGNVLLAFSVDGR